MTTNNANYPNLLDFARRSDPDGSIADVVEILNQTNAIVQDAYFVEGNLPTGHRTTVRTGFPAPTWRKLYGGVQPGKSTTVQVTDSCGMLEQYAEVDKALADLNGNTAAWRASEEKPFVEAMAQELAKTMFYGDTSKNAERFLGLSARYNSKTAASGFNIIDAGGVGSDNGSVWLLTWADDATHGIIPKGSKAGIQMEDKGQVTLEAAPDGSGGRMEAYRTHYRLDAGLTVRDWTKNVRIANIDSSDLDTLANTKNLITWMIMAIERLPEGTTGHQVFYMNRRFREKLRLGIIEKISSQLNWETVAGKRVMVFDDIVVKRCDQLSIAETQVT